MFFLEYREHGRPGGSSALPWIHPTSFFLILWPCLKKPKARWSGEKKWRAEGKRPRLQAFGTERQRKI